MRGDPLPGKGRMAEWRLRARALGLRDVLVWVPDGDQANIRQAARKLRHEAGIHMGGEDEVEDRIASLVEVLPELAASSVLMKALDRVRARAALEKSATPFGQAHAPPGKNADVR